MSSVLKLIEMSEDCTALVATVQETGKVYLLANRIDTGGGDLTTRAFEIAAEAGLEAGGYVSDESSRWAGPPPRLPDGPVRYYTASEAPGARGAGWYWRIEDGWGGPVTRTRAEHNVLGKDPPPETAATAEHPGTIAELRSAARVLYGKMCAAIHRLGRYESVEADEQEAKEIRELLTRLGVGDLAACHWQDI
jgi:hypothetical protein